MPNLIRAPQDFAVTHAYSNVKQVAQSIGEECIALRMYHVFDDGPTQPRCAVCYDEDYKGNDDPNCAYCYGSTFHGGIRQAYRVWSIFSDDNGEENFRKDGVWNREDHEVQTEPHPLLEENDYLIRVKKWDSTRQFPLEVGFRYRIEHVVPVSVRTGARFGHNDTDKIAQKMHATLLPKTNVIYKYDIFKELTFPRRDGQPR